MRTVGIIGGIGPESTIDYYRSILTVYHERKPAGPAPSLLINSIDLNKLRSMFDAKAHSEIVRYLATEVGRLAAAGADFAIISANTPHMVFDDLVRQCKIPLVSIVETTRDEAERLGLRKLGLLGTRFTMEASFFQYVFSRRNIALVVPNSDERIYIHDRYFAELVNGVFPSETRDRLLAIASRLKEQEQIDGVILAGTELPLLLRDASGEGIQFLDTTQIHVNAVVEELLRD
jgi:aspartate racemase